jgi:hypothetical protein
LRPFLLSGAMSTGRSTVSTSVTADGLHWTMHIAAHANPLRG